MKFGFVFLFHSAWAGEREREKDCQITDRHDPVLKPGYQQSSSFISLYDAQSENTLSQFLYWLEEGHGMAGWFSKELVGILVVYHKNSSCISRHDNSTGFTKYGGPKTI